MRSLLSAVTLLAAAACASSARAPRARPEPAAGAVRAADWVDATLARMSLREKAAQMVWPSVWGDYVSADSRQWQLAREWVGAEKVGGLTISVGSPLEIAAKLNALQRMADVPLLVGADLESGA